jgi:WD40 repeat protein
VFCLAALDAQRYLSGGRDGTIRLNTHGQGSATVAQHTQSVLGLHVISPTRYAAVSRDAGLTIHALDAAAPLIQANAHAGAVLCVSGFATRLYTGGADHQIGIWDQQARPIGRLLGHRGWVWDLAVLDEQRLLSVSEDRRVLLWHNGVVISELDLGQPLRAVLLRPHSPQLMIADAAGYLHLLALSDLGVLLTRKVQAHTAPIRRLRLGVNGCVLSCAEDGQIKRWDWQLNGGDVVVQSEGFVTDVLQLGTGLVSAGYAGGVIEH